MQKIVANHFNTTSSIPAQKKKRLNTQGCGTILTNIDELARRTIKKKKTIQRKKPKITAQITTLTLNEDRSSHLDQSSCIVDMQQSHAHNTIDSSITLPPFSSILPISNSTNQLSLSDTLNSLVAPENLMTFSDTQCQSCFISIDRSKLLDGCHRCLAPICSSCNTANDGGDHLCRKCKPNMMKTTERYQQLSQEW